MQNNPSEVEIVQLFSEIGRSLKKTMRKSFECNGLTMPQSMVMSTLIKRGEMKISEISSELHLSNSTISGIIDRLEKHDLVIRTRSEQDRRIVYVKVSPKYVDFHREFHHQAEKDLQKILSRATPEDMRKILEGLTALKKILGQ
ncbi:MULTISPECIES: MarR family transcriptional regulator [Dehalobacter]|uniref:MarR family transcriptional regulator n=2 Tax=Dehalobacter restrictus TaxID=55583 RepID=A0A857DM03_9FIRM|nr:MULTISPECIES: MarR family transcriptional regulator [Dehalobacter]AHF10989.1 TrmB family transcriptional regulator [Dehalobacter restrictus DSM 9455]MCG1024758.1 MarR family transcriptional regulator [Dehalobacter sp.]MCM1565581.1 MarR family transcriptional regulator [Dehalobacter sp.]MDJ0307065.1 MarR family transcriptional regulator [Dehalobacter sp.]OCZ49604.1 TrmB family transcriptional regulator [Dehalobacter sp. TeCB1]